MPMVMAVTASRIRVMRRAPVVVVVRKEKPATYTIQRAKVTGAAADIRIPILKLTMAIEPESLERELSGRESESAVKNR